MRSSNCVYKIPYTGCSFSSVGQTGRRLETRLNEHKRDQKINASSGINDHATKTGHIIDYEGAKILRYEENELRRIIFESLYLKKFKHFDNNSCSFGLSLF